MKKKSTSVDTLLITLHLNYLRLCSGEKGYVGKFKMGMKYFQSDVLWKYEVINEVYVLHVIIYNSGCK